MPTLQFPYGKEFLTADIPEARLQAVLVSELHHYNAPASSCELVEAALAVPVGSAPLCQLSRGKENIVIIASDHTRPVPSR